MGCCCSKEETEEEESRTPLLHGVKKPTNSNVPESIPKYQATEDVPAVITKQPMKHGQATVETQVISEEPPPTSVDHPPVSASESSPQPLATDPTPISISPVIVPEVHQKLQEQAELFNNYLDQSQELKTSIEHLKAMYPDSNPDKTLEGCFGHVKDTLGTDITERVALLQRSSHFYWLEYKADKVHHSILAALNGFNKSNRLVDDILGQGTSLVSSINEMLACEGDMHNAILSSSLKTDESIRRFDESIKQFKGIEPIVGQIKCETLDIAELLQTAVNILGITKEDRDTVTIQNLIGSDSSKQEIGAGTEDEVLTDSPSKSAPEGSSIEHTADNQSTEPQSTSNSQNTDDTQIPPESQTESEPQSTETGNNTSQHEEIETSKDDDKPLPDDSIPADQIVSPPEEEEPEDGEPLEESVASGKTEFHSLSEANQSVGGEEDEEAQVEADETISESDATEQQTPCEETSPEQEIGPAEEEKIEASSVASYEDTFEEESTLDPVNEPDTTVDENDQSQLESESALDVQPASPESASYMTPDAADTDTGPSTDWQTAESGATSDDVPTISEDVSTEDQISD